MNQSYLGFLNERLENMDYVPLIEKIGDRNVYVWGADEKGLLMADILMKHGIRIVGALDSNLYGRETKFGIIKHPGEVIFQGNQKEVFIFVTLMLKNRKVLNELKEHGFEEDDFFYPGQIWSFIPEDTGMTGKHYMRYLLSRGEELAKQLDENKVYFLFWEGNIGDLVRPLMLMDEFKKEKQISSITVIVKKRYENLARLLLAEEDEVLAFHAEELKCLFEYSKYQGRSVFNIIGVEWPFYTLELFKIAPIEFGRIYTTLCAMKIWGLPYKDKYEFKYISGFGIEDKEVKRIIESEKINERNSVIFIPYAQSVPMLPKEFWEILVEKYRKRGYEIYTNAADGEKEIPGTKALSIPLEYMIDVVNYAGHAVGVRCGLIDLLALGQCNCQVINPFKDEYMEALLHGYSIVINGEDSILYKNAHYVDLSKLDCKALAEEIINKDLGTD